MRSVNIKKEVKRRKASQVPTHSKQDFIHYVEAKHGIIRKTMEKTGGHGDSVRCLSSQTNNFGVTILFAMCL